MLTGIRNLHPQVAIQWMNSDAKNDVAEFYRKLGREYE
jgi:hypothetical protein